MASVLLAVLGISLLMIVHEAGHLLAARASGMRVKTFSIGFGPALFKLRPKGSETTYKICVVPLLAYVEIDGANPLEELDPKDAGLYGNKGVAARAFAMAGGPLANYLLASLVVFGLALSGWREERPSSPMIVGQVEPGSPAAGAGFRAGDAIVEVEGQAVRDIGDITRITAARPGQATSYVLRRDGATLPPITVVPRDASGRGVIGVASRFETHVENDSIGEALERAAIVPFTQTVESAKAIVFLVSHRTTQGLTGPVGMAKELASQADRGVYAFLFMLLSMSVALGFFNLLPLPFLDGGRLVFLLVEALKGRRLNPNVEAIAHATGMIILLGAAALITWRDIVG